MMIPRITKSHGKLRTLITWPLAVGLILLLGTTESSASEFRAGAAVLDMTPKQLPVLLNGGMLTRQSDRVRSPITARAIALDDGSTKVVLMVVDSCMMPRALLDQVKAAIAEHTGVAADHVTIAATHSHTAPSCMGCLGTDADPNYVKQITSQLPKAAALALARLEPAKVGFAKADAGRYTALRRWIRRPDRIAEDPFGNPTVRANMHSANNWDDVTGPSGPEDPDLSLIAFQTRGGRPIAALANFSMHYFGDRDISADYFGLFCNRLQQRVAAGNDFVAALSHGCSGDIWRRDYAKPPGQRDEDMTMEQYTDALVDIAATAYETIEYQTDVELAMAERRLPMKYRVPDRQRLEWAERIVQAMGDRPPKDREEVYAREQVILADWKETEVVVQAIRIGSIAIATTPTETYAITGLKIKAASPLADTIVLDLTNGGDGYIPPPEQHLLGGYNTWPARSAGLEVNAEPRIAEACIELLEEVADQPRRTPHVPRGPAAQRLLDLRPAAWWRLDEFSGPHARDGSAQHHGAIYEPPVAFYLEGPHSESFTPGATNRAAMFAGGRLSARVENLADRYSVSLWFWNGMPVDGRPITGWIFARGPNHGTARYSDHVGIGGKGPHQGKAIFLHGNDLSHVAAGNTVIPRWQWQHLAFVRDGQHVRVWLNGSLEIDVQASADFPNSCDQLFFGGGTDHGFSFEGRLDEVAVFQRPLDAKEVGQLAAP